MAPKIITYKRGHIPKSLPSKVYLDANFLFDCRIPQQKFYKAANALLTALMLKKGSTFYVSTLALDEVWKNTPKIAAGIVIKGKQGWVTQMSQFRSKLDNFQKFIEKHRKSGKLKIIGVPPDAANEAYDIMVNTPIMPRDAFHVATALYHNVPNIISNDRDLTNVNRNIILHQYQ